MTRPLRSTTVTAASTLLRACPPPQTTQPAPHGVPVVSHDHSSLGLPVFRSTSSSVHANATTPAEPLDAVAILSNGDGLPLKRERSASASVLFEACSAFTHVPACMVAKPPKVARYQSTSTHVVTSLRRSGCFRPSDRLAGWDSHPLEIADFRGILDFRHVSSGPYVY